LQRGDVHLDAVEVRAVGRTEIDELEMAVRGLCDLAVATRDAVVIHLQGEIGAAPHHELALLELEHSTDRGRRTRADDDQIGSVLLLGLPQEILDAVDCSFVLSHARARSLAMKR
jgi:hypothetical protein